MKIWILSKFFVIIVSLSKCDKTNVYTLFGLFWKNNNNNNNETCDKNEKVSRNPEQILQGKTKKIRKCDSLYKLWQVITRCGSYYKV